MAAVEESRRTGCVLPELSAALAALGLPESKANEVSFGSAVFACRPGDGSAREQAASCQRVLGGCANIAYEYATKRYRSNCINWGILPFTLPAGTPFDYTEGDLVFVPDVREKLRAGETTFPATVLRANGEKAALTLTLSPLTDTEREILLCGCLMNYYAAHQKS